MAQPSVPTTLPSSNGVLSAPTGRAIPGGNKKKQKRKAKAARMNSEPEYASANGLVAAPNDMPLASPYVPPQHPGSQAMDDYDDTEFAAELEFDPQGAYYSDAEEERLAYEDAARGANGMYADGMDPGTSKKKNRKKKKKRQSTGDNTALPLQPPGRSRHEAWQYMNNAFANMTPRERAQANLIVSRAPQFQPKDRIWNTSTQEERERIKEFWLSLSEKDRRDLLKIEKEAVLKKMKEQQKHSCSCTVCGRKRTAIEEELEVLYDAYYEELEQYANHQADGDLDHPNPHPPPPQRQPREKRPLPPDIQRRYEESVMRRRAAEAAQQQQAPPLQPQHRTSRVQEILDDEDEDGDFSEGEEEEDEDEEEYSDEEEDDYYSSEDYEEEEYETRPGLGGGFFDFGNSLTVKGRSFITDMLTQWQARLNSAPGGILTVADDLLKNDGKKFIEMMEQLAERRMQREQEAEYAAREPSHMHPNGDPSLDDEEDDYEDDYGSEEEDDYEEEEEDEMVRSLRSYHVSGIADNTQGGMTEEQRMEEGRRMFQIFAARMFEQRVLNAYKEKVAAERQRKLLEELDEDEKMGAEKEAKKARDAEKKRNKKLAQKQAKAEEKAKKDAEKAAEEAKIREAEQQKQEAARQRKEEQKKKKEAEKKAQEDERLRKEAERVKRQQEERDRQQEAERKLREQKMSEKKLKEEARKREQEEREAREKEAREKKAHDDAGRKDQEARVNAQKQTKTQDSKAPATVQPPQIVKRPSQAGAVAVPPGLLPQKSASGTASPHVAVATPVLPKPATPAGRPRQASYQDSYSSYPMLPSLSNGPSKSTSPSSTDQQSNTFPKAILQNPSKQQQTPVTLPHPPQQSGPQPPPGMHPPYNTGFGNMGFPPYQGQMSAQSQRQQMPGFPQQPSIGGQYRSYAPSNPPPGITGLGMPQGRGFPGDAPPGFGQQLPPMSSPIVAPGFISGRSTMPAHSRQHSIGDRVEPDSHNTAPTQPISRPTPIQRPSSVRPSEAVIVRNKGRGNDVDDLSKHLGSSALLDDVEDEPMMTENRRASNPLGPPQRAMGIGSPLFGSVPGSATFGNAPGTWSSGNSNPFGPPSLGNPGWGASTWGNGSFGSLGAPGRQPTLSRPRSIRLAVCNACRQLNTPSGDNFHDVSHILSLCRSSAIPEGPPTLQEIEEICETEGDNQNGGGTLLVRRSGSSNFAVKYDAEDGTSPAGRPSVNALGEIGSPVPSHATPAFGARAFGSIGALAPGAGSS
ncbi:hypothetical protein MBLNU457_3974t1 [Dothideomycetes sp. NU457]